ncbi:CsbD family protein [Caryophanon tenue]|uniref:CsbD family protein n=1 Tax=Caryophanon tenue TaxID=33978 RepID=A0A1C0YDG0_9BACL|nr:CsbD family protein [Caryophanon tenue]OCS85185.1 CsbD family protein [Caryophanon tenue]
MSLSDDLKSTVNKVKGEIKEQVGNATGDRSTEMDGKKDKLKGQVQETIGDIKDKFSNKDEHR